MGMQVVKLNESLGMQAIVCVCMYVLNGIGYAGSKLNGVIGE